MTRRLFLAATAAASASLAWPGRTARAQTTGVAAPPVEVTAVVRHHAALVHATYEDTLAAALDLQRAVTAFLARPADEPLAAARGAWREAREWYGQTEAFRFYGGPVDAENGPEGRLNAWPLDEAYIDAVAGRPTAGFVNDPKVALSKATLMRLNERGGEENIACGWHAIEFMLWGQDRDDVGPGARPASHFVDGGAPNAARRRQYLALVTDLLVDDLRGLLAAWAPNARNYRAAFERGGLESLRRLIVGLGSLSRGELAGERMEVALNSQDQEDEHSCFSDNTHRDIVANATGIENVWTGRYRRRDGTLLEGPSPRALVAAADPAVAERTTRDIAASVAAAQAIQAPFDREVRGGRDAQGRRRIQATIDSLVAQSKDLVQAAAAVGLTRLSLVLPS